LPVASPCRRKKQNNLQAVGLRLRMLIAVQIHSVSEIFVSLTATACDLSGEIDINGVRGVGLILGYHKLLCCYNKKLSIAEKTARHKSPLSIAALLSESWCSAHFRIIFKFAHFAAKLPLIGLGRLTCDQQVASSNPGRAIGWVTVCVRVNHLGM